MPDQGLITKVSPSSLSTIRRCGLAAFYGRTRSRNGGPQPSSPPARLGNAVHEVLCWLAKSDDTVLRSAGLEEMVRAEWRSALVIEGRKSSLIAAESVFGSPDGWPSRSLTEERLVITAEQLAPELAAVVPEDRSPELSAESARAPVRGTIDLCLVSNAHTRIIDYKAGDVRSTDLDEGGRYRTQLLLYASLARERGLTPTSLELWPIGRPVLSLRPTDEMIDVAVIEAVHDLDVYNALASAGDERSLASPSDDACRWCEFSSTCSVLWGDGYEQLHDVQAVRGQVTGTQQSRNGKLALKVDVIKGTKVGSVVIAGLDTGRFPQAADIRIGDVITAAGLAEAAPGSATLSAARSRWSTLHVSYQVSGPTAHATR